MYVNVSYINKSKLNKNRGWRNKWERDRLVVVVCVVVLLMNHLDNKKAFKSFYIFKHVL